MHVICLTWCVGTAWRQVCSLRRHLWHRWNLLQCCHRWGQSFGKKVGEDMWLCVGWEGLWLCHPVPAFLLCLSLETMADPEFPSCHLHPQTKQPPPSHRFTLKQKHIIKKLTKQTIYFLSYICFLMCHSIIDAPDSILLHESVVFLLLNISFSSVTKRWCTEMTW